MKVYTYYKDWSHDIYQGVVIAPSLFRAKIKLCKEFKNGLGVKEVFKDLYWEEEKVDMSKTMLFDFTTMY